MNPAETAGTRVFENSLILQEICGWVEFAGKRDLVSCMVANKHGFELAGKSMYGTVKEQVQVDLMRAGCSLERLMQYMHMVRFVQIEQHEIPSVQFIRQFKSRFPHARHIIQNAPPEAPSWIKHLAYDTCNRIDLLHADEAEAMQPAEAKGCCGQVLGNMQFLWDGQSPDIDLFDPNVGLIGLHKRYRLQEFEVRRPPPVNTPLGLLFSEEGALTQREDELRGMFKDTRALQLPWHLPGDSFQTMLSLFPNVDMMTCSVRSRNRYTQEVHQGLVKAMKQMVKTSPKLDSVHLIITGGIGSVDPYDFEDFLAIEQIISFEGLFDTTGAVAAFVQAGSYASTVLELRRADTSRKSGRNVAALRIGMEAVSVNAFHAAWCVLLKHTEETEVELCSDICYDQALELWLRSVEDICASLIRSAIGSGRAGYRHVARVEKAGDDDDPKQVEAVGTEKELGGSGVGAGVSNALHVEEGDVTMSVA